MHIAITGNIGAGKTTLAEQLGQYYGWTVLPEAVDGNPYLADFYQDMPRWSFNLQVFFLNSRFEQVRQIRELVSAPVPQTVVQDRTIYEDAYIFAQNLVNTGRMPQRDYQTYRRLFDNMLRLVSAPDLMIYLRADLPRLKQHIRQRGRAYEQDIPTDYLASLNLLYEQFVADYHAGALLIMDVNDLDYARQPADFQVITKQIDKFLADRRG
jgi:deoxyadenosine/deoxycytidine kinase